MSMINWNEFEHIHVIKKLKHILNTWWNIDVVFSDERGELKGIDSSKLVFNNPAIGYLLEKDAGKANLGELVTKTLEDLRSTNNKYALKKWEMAGFDIGIFPIMIENDCVGTVVALGYFKDDQVQQRLLEVKERLAAFGVPGDYIEKLIIKMKYLDDQERQHYCELCELVAQEIVTLHLEITRRDDRIRELNNELGKRFKYDSMVGKSKPMQEMYGLLDKIRGSDTTVLIQGENGTGKELIAKSIHYHSNRKDKIFVAQNFTAINDNLLEAELFGAVRGAYTGSVKDRKGLFESADKGTLFLDEVGDISPSMQVKLLRVIQEGTFMAVGSTETKKIDVRIIAATNKNLKEMIEQGTFREDLFYRLNIINIRVPPLRERKEDIPYLVDYFMKKVSEQKHAGGVTKVLTSRALEKLYDYAWPGNVRELQNEIERVYVLSGTETKITVENLSPKIIEASESNKVQGARLQGRLKDAIQELEREMIREGLRRTGWNKSKLSKELGISRANLIDKVQQFGLDKRRITR
jgi:two-component system response regulator HupR/HoxA